MSAAQSRKDMQHIVGATLLSLYGVILYATSLRNGYAFDDVVHIEQNPSLRSISSLLSAAFSPIFPGDLFRPITVLSNGIIALVCGNGPLYQHLVNLILHTCNILLVYQVLLRLNVVHPALFAALWGSLPAHIEVVSNCTGRAELLAFFFGASAFLLAHTQRQSTQRKGLRRWSFISLLFLLAMNSKESGVMWLVAILFPICTSIYRKEITLTESVRHATPFMCALLLYCGLRYNAFGSFSVQAIRSSLDNPLVEHATAERIFMAIALLGRYAISALYPLSVGADYSWGFLLPTSDYLPLSCYFVVAVLLLVAAVFFSRRHAIASVALLWFFIAFLPTSNLILPIGTIFGDRLNYTPTIGIVCTLALAAKSSEVLTVISAIWTAILAIFAVLLTPIWRDNYSLYTHQIAISPGSIKTQVNYGVVLRNGGRLTEARAHILSALHRYPDYAEARYLLSQLAFMENDPALGTQELSRTLAINPRLPEALNLAGRVALNERRYRDAQEYFDRLAENERDSVNGLIGKLAVAIATEDHKTARSIFLRLKEIAPENKEVQMLGMRLQ